MRFGLWAPRLSITTSSDLHAISATAPSRRRSRIPARWSLLLRPATAPSPPRSCSKATSCSCLCLAAPPDTDAHSWEHSHRSVPTRYASRTRPRTPISRRRSPRPPSPARSPSRTHRVPYQLVPLFPRGADAGYGATHGGATYSESCHSLYVVAALLEGEVGAFLEIGGKEPPCLLVKLRSRAGFLLRSQGFSPLGLADVSFDRGEAHGEGASRLGLGHTAFHCGDHPSSEVF